MLHDKNEMCKGIAEELEKFAAGEMFKCEECGHIAEPGEDGECENCGSTELEALGVYDWLEDVLDIEYTISGRGEYLGARVMVTCGGPNIYVNTRAGRVELFWWGDRADWAIEPDAVEALDQIMCEEFEILRAC